jgi:hypothetical protein
MDNLREVYIQGFYYLAPHARCTWSVWHGGSCSRILTGLSVMHEDTDMTKMDSESMWMRTPT